MKVIKKLMTVICIFALVLSLCSCAAQQPIEANTSQNAEQYIAEEDYQGYISEFSTFAKAKDGYYFTNNCTLFFYDTESHQAYPACNKTNCSHSDSKCQAFLSPTTFQIGGRLFYYNNAIYLLGFDETDSLARGVYLYQISLDTFKQKKVAYLFDTVGELSFVFALHRGYIYFTYEIIEENNNETELTKTTATLYRVKLGELNKDAKETIFEFKNIGASIGGLCAWGNTLFFNTCFFADEQGNGYETVFNMMDIHTLKNETLTEGAYSSHYASDGKIYYYTDETHVSYYDMATKEHKSFATIDGPCYISADSNYLYFDNKQAVFIGKTKKEDRAISVYNKSGEFITKIVPKGLSDWCYFGGDDVMLFQETVAGEEVEENGASGYYVLDKSELTSPNRQFIDMES